MEWVPIAPQPHVQFKQFHPSTRGMLEDSYFNDRNGSILLKKGLSRSHPLSELRRIWLDSGWKPGFSSG